ncbi:MAG TPA: ABC transporter substrate-binding protein [Candidatus Dormibacteraeota bacterium]|jgi:NitT/TauT family transport system substrate-binding protein
MILAPGVRRSLGLGLAAMMLLAACGGSGNTGQASPKSLLPISISAIGEPPIFLSVYIAVAKQKGYFEKVGLQNPDIRWFQNGAQVATQVITGNAVAAVTATQASEIAMAGGTPIVAIGGLNNQDFFVASNLPDVHGCTDLKGKVVAYDQPNGARDLYLKAYLATCGLAIGDVKLVSSQNAPLIKAGIAGQVTTGVFHINELAAVEADTHKTWTKLERPDVIQKNQHYAMLIVQKSSIQSQRDLLVRFLAAWILSLRFMQDSKNTDAFAKIASDATGDPLEADKLAIAAFQKIGFWDQTDSGLTQSRVLGSQKILQSVGAIKANPPPGYNDMVDLSLYPDALKMANSAH